MKKGSCIVLKWLTALMLSPGMIFTTAYLLAWSSVNLYLDKTFKEELGRSFASRSGTRYRLVIGSLRSGPDLNSLTIKKLELYPLENGTNERKNETGLQIAELHVQCPDLCFFPFRPAWATLSAHLVTLEILAQYRSMNHHTGSLPSNRGYLVDRIGKDRQVGIP
ncbi:MAG TPA: hypothetical protein VN371_02030 [Chlorobaculum sp.]|nr:hypothetical protein [Chlorobaculum sp.]